MDPQPGHCFCGTHLQHYPRGLKVTGPGGGNGVEGGGRNCVSPGSEGSNGVRRLFPWAPSSELAARQGKGSLGIRAGAWTILEKVAPAGRPQVLIPGVRRGPRAEDTPYRRADRGRHQRGRSQACGARARTQHLSGGKGRSGGWQGGARRTCGPLVRQVFRDRGR